MSNRRKDDAVLTDAPAPAPPRMADLHPPFGHALQETLRLELEISALLYPENPPEVADPVQRAEAYSLRRDTADRLQRRLVNQKQTLAEERAVASAKVVSAVRPEFDVLENAVADRARELLAAFDARERFLTPLARDGCHFAVMAGAGLPPYVAEPVRTWLRSFERGKSRS